LELGGRFIDTARAYGTSEQVIGRALSEHHAREEVFLATKNHNTATWDGINQLRNGVEESLRNLKTEYVDLLQIHTPPTDPDLIGRALEIFVDLKNEGKTRFIGASVSGPDVTEDTVQLARRYIDTGAIDAIQLIYSIFRRTHETTMAYAHERGVAVIARTVLESGFLTGKYRSGQEFSGHRARWEANRRDKLLDVAENLASHTIEPPYQSLGQVAAKFALTSPHASVIIPGAKTVEQVEANCSVDELPALSAPALSAIDALPKWVASLANTQG